MLNRDTNSKAAKALSNMFAGATIDYYSFNGGTITLTLVGGDTIAIRHETKRIDFASASGYTREERKYVSGGILSRVEEAIKNGQAITAAWVEKREAYESPTPLRRVRRNARHHNRNHRVVGDVRGRPAPHAPHP